MKGSFIKSTSAAALLPFAARTKSEDAGAAVTEMTEPKAAPAAAPTPASSRRVKLALVLALIGSAGLGLLPAHATPQSGVKSVPIADGPFGELDIFTKTDLNPGKAKDFWMAAINSKGPSHLYIVQNTVDPGGSFGWHSHPGPSLVIVMSGTATEYEGNDPTCTPHVFPAAQPGAPRTTFIDAGAVTGHLVRNEDSVVPLVVIVVRLIPEAMVPSQRIDLPNPGYCPTLN